MNAGQMTLIQNLLGRDAWWRLVTLGDVSKERGQLSSDADRQFTIAEARGKQDRTDLAADCLGHFFSCSRNKVKHRLWHTIKMWWEQFLFQINDVRYHHKSWAWRLRLENYVWGISEAILSFYLLFNSTFPRWNQIKLIHLSLPSLILELRGVYGSNSRPGRIARCHLSVFTELVYCSHKHQTSVGPLWN